MSGEGGRVNGEGRCVCTIRDKIMAPQGLVWPCTRSIKRQLQVPRSTLMSIFWGLILHTEHQQQYTHAHCKHTWTYLLSCMVGCDSRYTMLAYFPTGIIHKWHIAAGKEEEKGSEGQSGPSLVTRMQCWRLSELVIDLHKDG